MPTTGACTDPQEIHGVLWRGWAGGLAFDVGGNVGQSVPELLERFDRVVTFEPAAESWEVLTTRLAGNDQVTCRNLAVSDYDGMVSLWEEDDNLAQGQLISPTLYGWSWLGDKTPRQVPCRTLDTLTAEYGIPDFVKIDTEGHELRILNGAPRLLKTGQTGWMIEFHSEALHKGIVATLSQAGYTPVTVRHPHYPSGSFHWLNHGFLRAEAPRKET